MALATQANSLASYQPDVAMLLAATAYRTAHTREAIDALTRMASKWGDADKLIPTGMKDVSQIAFSPTDPTMVALTSPHGIELWDVKKKTRRRRPDSEGADTSVFSPDGSILAYTQNVEQQGSKVFLWSYTENRVVREIPLNLAPKESPGNLTFSSDGNLLGACVGHRIQLWSPDTGRLRYLIPLAHDDTVCGFGFRNGSRELVYVDGDDIITWDIATGAVITKNDAGPHKKEGPNLSGKGHFFSGVDSTFTVAPDGRSAMYQGAIYQEDNEGNKSYTTSDGWWDFDHQKAEESEVHTDYPQVSFATHGHHVAMSSGYLHDDGRAVTIVDGVQRTPIAAYRVSHSFALSPDGDTIAAVDESGVIALTDTDTGRHHGIPAKARRIAVQPGNGHLTAVSDDEVAIYHLSDHNPDPTIVSIPKYYTSLKELRVSV